MRQNSFGDSRLQAKVGLGGGREGGGVMCAGPDVQNPQVEGRKVMQSRSLVLNEGDRRCR